MQINLSNVEELIFYNKKINKLLPEFAHCFDQWKMSKRIPALKNLGSQALIDFLAEVSSEDISKLELFFNEKVTIDKLDNQIITNQTTTCDKLQEILCKQVDFQDFCISRKGEQVYISFWR
jgi:hypothetical protein